MLFLDNTERYPLDWREISLFVKEANHWQCQECGQQCRKPGEPYDTMRRTLTVAHHDHVYFEPEIFVSCLCCPCHLRHDARAAWVTRRRQVRQRRLEAGQMSIFRQHAPQASAADVAELEAAWPEWSYLEKL